MSRKIERNSEASFRRVVVVRYADDVILGFQYGMDADRFLESLRERLAKFWTGVTRG